jgi:hypothetical protein
VIDTKEKPFACFCGAAFTRQDLLRRHERLAHAGHAAPSGLAPSTSATFEFPRPSPLQNSARETQILGLPRDTNDDAPGMAQGSVPMLPYLSQDITPANSIVATYDDPLLLDPVDSFEAFLEDMGLPPDFISSPFSLNANYDPAKAEENTSLDENIFGNGDFDNSTAGPLPFSTSLYPCGAMQNREAAISGDGKLFS